MTTTQIIPKPFNPFQYAWYWLFRPSVGGLIAAAEKVVDEEEAQINKWEVPDEWVKQVIDELPVRGPTAVVDFRTKVSAAFRGNFDSLNARLYSNLPELSLLSYDDWRLYSRNHERLTQRLINTYTDKVADIIEETALTVKHKMSLDPAYAVKLDTTLDAGSFNADPDTDEIQN